MAEGYTIVNGKPVKGRTLTFDDSGLKVDGETVVERQEEEPKFELEPGDLEEPVVEKKKVNKKALLCSLVCITISVIGGYFVYKEVKKHYE